MRVTDYLKDHPDRLAAVYERMKRLTDTTGECHVWTSETFRGYPVLAVRLNGTRRRFKVHRMVWEKKHGPTKLTIDHVCRNKLCVRLHKDHLEAVTAGENVRRENIALHGSNPPHRCKNNHKNLYAVDRQGKHYCKGCHRDAARATAAKKRAAK